MEEKAKQLKNIFIDMGLSIEVTASLLGNIKVESNFIPQTEKMGYSSFGKLKETFPSYFRTMSEEKAKQYIKQPKKLGDFVYAALATEKLANGDVIQHSGYDFRGRGFIQITGFANYKKYGKILGIDLVKNPDLACDPDIASKIAVLYIKEVTFKIFPDSKDSKDIKYVADCVTKSIQGAGKNYKSGFLKKHLEDKRNASVIIYGEITSESTIVEKQKTTVTLIKKGDTGDKVVEVQRLLIKHGYNILDDGDFGKKTFDAVEAFQKKNGLINDGVVGRSTLEILKK